MSMSKWKIATVWLLIVSLLPMISSCNTALWLASSQPDGRNAERGTLAGAYDGGMIGQAIGEHHNNGFAGWAIGTVAGALIGNVIGSKIDQTAVLAQAGITSEDYSHVVLSDVRKPKLKRGSKFVLSHVAQRVNADPMMNVEIYAHTDNSGSHRDRLIRTQQVAQSVVRYLLSLGVQVDRIYAKPCADQYPVAGNDTKQGRKRNCRVEIFLTQPNSSVWSQSY